MLVFKLPIFLFFQKSSSAGRFNQRLYIPHYIECKKMQVNYEIENKHFLAYLLKKWEPLEKYHKMDLTYKVGKIKPTKVRLK